MQQPIQQTNNENDHDQKPDKRKRTDASKATNRAHEMGVDIEKLDVVIKTTDEAGKQVHYFKPSPLRWRILLGICILGFCNRFSSESYAILNVYVGALDTCVSTYVYMSQMFFFVPWVASFSSAFVVDQGGIRLAIYTALFYATIRNSARALLFAPETPGWRHLRWIYWATQNVFTQLTVSQYYTLPLRLAESWFPEAESSLALNLLLGAPLLGTACASLLYPLYIPDFKHARLLSYANLIMAGTCIFVISTNVHRSKPLEGAPSARNQRNLAKLGERDQETLWARFRKVFANKQYLLRVMVLAFADPLQWTVQGIAQDIFMSAGLTKVFCGQYLALTNIVGAVMQIFCSYLWKARSRRRTRLALEARRHTGQDDTQQLVAASSDPYHTITCKWLLSIQCALFLTFCYSLIIHELHTAPWLVHSQWWLLIVTSIAYTAVRSWAAPYYSEQTAELVCCTISEPFSGACQMFADAFMLNVLNIFFVLLRQERIVHDSSSGMIHKRAIYKWSVLFEMALAVGSALLYVLKFNPTKNQL